MALTVKALLYGKWFSCEPIEVRRFTIDQDVAASYTALIQKLSQVFSDLKGDVKVTYSGIIYNI